MSISYPLSLPDTDIKRLTLMARNSVGLAMSPYSFQQTVYDWLSGIWMINIELPLIATKFEASRQFAEEWQAFLLSLKGPLGTFLAGDDTAGTPRGVATGTPLVNGASQTGSSLVTDGWTASQTGILKAGDYLSVGSGVTTRLHKLLQDADSDAGGNATFDIFPELRESPADNAVITTSNCKGTFRLLDPDVQITSIDKDKFHTIAFQGIEAI